MKKYWKNIINVDDFYKNFKILEKYGGKCLFKM